MRRWLVLVLALVVLALAAPALAQEKPRYGGELVFAVPSEMPSYDGHRESTFGWIHPIAPHYNTLLRVDPFDKSGSKPTSPSRGRFPETVARTPSSCDGASSFTTGAT